MERERDIGGEVEIPVQRRSQTFQRVGPSRGDLTPSLTGTSSRGRVQEGRKELRRGEAMPESRNKGWLCEVAMVKWIVRCPGPR